MTEMTAFQRPEPGEALRDTHAQLQEAYDTIRSLQRSLDQTHEAALLAQSCLAEADTHLQQLRDRVKTAEDATAVMYRELSYLEEASAPGAVARPDVTLRAVTALLRLSVRLAAYAYPPEQLLTINREPQTARAADLMRQRWLDWLEELTSYLAKVVPLAGMLAGEGGLLSTAYRQKLTELRALCERLPLPSGEATEGGAPMAADPAAAPATQSPQAPRMKFLTAGPLSNLRVVPESMMMNLALSLLQAEEMGSQGQNQGSGPLGDHVDPDQVKTAPEAASGWTTDATVGAETGGTEGTESTDV